MSHDPSVLDPLLGPTDKGFPQTSPPLRRSQIGEQGWSVLNGDLPLPLAVIKRRELAHNLGWMQRFCNERGIGLAPHGKTTMSPQLFSRQIDAGAWGMTLATVGQARVAIEAGVRNILIANQVLAEADLRAIDALKAKHADLRLLFLVDSIAQLALIEAAGASGSGFGEAASSACV
jgi:D-serine dehydratase